MATISPNNQLPEDVVASDLSTVSPQYKVHIPKKCLTATDWPSQPSTPVPLIAELIEFGRVRLHIKAEIQQQIDALRAGITQGDAADRFENIGVLNDKYRDATFYTKEKTVFLEPVIVIYLGVTKNGDRQVFVEARKSFIDIMSLEYRIQRLEKFREGTAI
ncbi:MAG TPA: hypothetical protein VMV33_10570 [Rhodocyclaceae bacterium]|nr:hypothetical protein [Rhodocyclaceae bacterium]